MKAIKRRLAVVLAVLLMLPAQPVMAVEALPDGIVTEKEDAGYDVTAGEEDSGEDVSTEDVADVENEASGDEGDVGVDSEDTEISNDAEGSVEDADLETDQDAVDSEDSADAETSEEEVVSGENENLDAGKDDVDADVGKEDGSEDDTVSDNLEAPGEINDSKDVKDDNRQGSSDSEDKYTEMDDEIPEEELADMELLLDDLTLASPSNLAKISAVAEDEVKFNTGNHVFSVVSREDFFDRELGDAFFDEDGSYTINIPEANPFFPYEVQFIYDGKESREWFMTPDDTVEIGGHEFRVSAYFDGTVVTQMSMKVGGDVVVAYPDEKEFTDEADGADPTSLLPLEERTLNFDFTGYTPVELTMISLDEIFVGDNALGINDKVLLSAYGDSYDMVNLANDTLDLSYRTMYGFVHWEMIVGDNDQLAAGNIRYNVRMNVTESENWLLPTVYKQDSFGNRTKLNIIENSDYSDYYNEDREMYAFMLKEELGDEEKVYFSLNINHSLFPSTRYADFRIYIGQHTSAASAQSDTDITSRILNVDMTRENAGIRRTVETYQWVTMVTYDSSGNATGCLPVKMNVGARSKRNSFSMSLYGKISNEDGNSITRVAPIVRGGTADEHGNITFTLYKGYSVDDIYYLRLSCSDEVASAYVGQYASREEAVAAGAKDIKGDLFRKYADDTDDTYVWRGYEANYRDGVSITIFMEEGGINDQDVYHYCFQVEEGTEDEPASASTNTYVNFAGVKDGTGNLIDAYEADEYEDSYGSRNYITFLVSGDVDLTRLAPIFFLDSGAKLYASGSDAPEVSGETYHDFSKGAVQYTVSAENGVDSKNYWLQIVKAGDGVGKLYINSFADKSSNTRMEGGVTYSTREMMFLSKYSEHDILLMNIGKDTIPALSAELVSDEVELDEYWTLKGDYALQGIDTTGDSSQLQSGELWNQAKLRIWVKDGVENGSDISGTLTIKSGNTILMVLNLTGYVGGPGITTMTIPQAVQYVPYGIMIQNNNKYSWNKTSYSITNGKLPSGMEMRPNGELYGVPKETGEFTFTVRLDNEESSFASNEKTFTLTVKENSDANVEASADPGYELTQRVQNMTLSATADQTLVSKGNYDEFVALYLDGEKLTEGTDYTSEAGSTRITIRGETLKKSNTPGKHTLGLEFRTKDTNTLKRVAQNYEITTTSTGSSNSSGGGGSSSGSTTSSIRDPRKGYMDANLGIITGAGDGYSNWKQDENGWKLIYADETVAAGYMAEQSDGTTVEQIIWEKVNGAWYAFGVNEYLKSGWVFDYQLGSWYWVSVDKGMQSGWYTDTQDGFTYYMDPATGKLAAGWKQIDEKWYYFNGISVSPTWVFDEKTGAWFYNVLSRRKPYGAMFKNEETPDGYFVNEDGAWDGKEK